MGKGEREMVLFMVHSEWLYITGPYRDLYKTLRKKTDIVSKERNDLYSHNLGWNR